MTQPPLASPEPPMYTKTGSTHGANADILCPVAAEPYWGQPHRTGRLERQRDPFRQ